MPSDRAPHLPPSLALAEIAVVPPEQRKPGNITAALGRLADFPAFAESLPAIDLDAADGEPLAELGALFTRVFLANAHSVLTAIVFVHGVTSLAATQLILPHVGEATTRLLLRYGWQAGCGLYACFGGRLPDEAGEPDRVEPASANRGDLVDRAIAHGDEHVIKFTEACLRLDARQPSPIYAAAVARVGELIPRR